MKKIFFTMTCLIIMALPMGEVYNVNFFGIAHAQEVAETTGDATTTEDTKTTKDATPTEEVGVVKGEKDDDSNVVASETDTGKELDSWGKADLWIGRLADLLIGLLSLVLMVLGWTIGKKWEHEKRLQKILGYARDVFPYIEAVAKKTDWKGDDKLVEFLKKIEEMLRAEDESPLGVGEIERLKIEAEKESKKEKTDR